jgi:hypothetical protein
MKLIDLSREIPSQDERLANHPMVIISQFTGHDEKRVADGYEFSSTVMSLSTGDHSGTHVDAPVHFDDRPGARSIAELPREDFFTEAVCLDLSHKPLKSDISIADLESAEKATGIEIMPGDTVLLHMDFYNRTIGTEAYITDFPGLSGLWFGVGSRRRLFRRASQGSLDGADLQVVRRRRLSGGFHVGASVRSATRRRFWSIPTTSCRMAGSSGR